jgi:hypothetical protein
MREELIIIVRIESKIIHISDNEIEKYMFKLISNISLYLCPTVTVTTLPVLLY